MLLLVKLPEVEQVVLKNVQRLEEPNPITSFSCHAWQANKRGASIQDLLQEKNAGARYSEQHYRIPNDFGIFFIPDVLTFPANYQSRNR